MDLAQMQLEQGLLRIHQLYVAAGLQLMRTAAVELQLAAELLVH